MRTLLTPAAWTAAPTCWVCDPANRSGLQVPFYLDDAGDSVTAEFWPESQHTGAPGLAHNGISLALLDEGMTWAMIAVAKRVGIVRRTEAEVRLPLRVGQAYTVSCRIDAIQGDELTALGEVRDGRGRVCATARATFSVLDPADVEDRQSTARPRR